MDSSPDIVIESTDGALLEHVASWAGVNARQCQRAGGTFNPKARLLIHDARQELPRSPLTTNTPSLTQVWLASDLCKGLQMFAQSQYLFALLSGPDALGPGELAPLFVLPGRELTTDLFTREPRSTFSGSIKEGEDHRQLVDKFQERIATIESFPDFAAVIAGAALELVMNATIDAPRAAQKKVSHSKQSKNKGAAVLVDASWDSSNLAIRVEDPWGSLSRQDVLESLQRAARAGRDQILSGPEGAGIGLWMVLQSLDQLHYSVTPSQRTVVTGVIRITKKWRDFQRKVKLLSFDDVRLPSDHVTVTP